jgi:iron complex outermembrane receptor protein
LALLGVGLSLIAAQAAFAQQKTDPSEEQPVKLEKFVVTGSNIPMTETAVEAGMFPVAVIDRTAIDQTGYTTAADLLQKITVSNGGSVPLSNNATGFTPSAASTSVHGLGPEATLVLINGHRVTTYPIGTGGTTAFVDLNTIPLSMVERVEVLKDGASANYGADAVAGVVNIILRSNYEGTEVNVGYGNTTTRDSSEFTSSITTGVSNDKGHMTVGFNFSSRDGIANRDRSYSAVPPFLSSNASPINAQISQLAYDEALGLAPGTPAPGSAASKIVFFGTPGLFKSGTNKTDPNGNLDTTATNDGHVAPGQWIYSSGRSSATNYNQWSDSYPPSVRYGVLVNGDRKIFGTDNIKFYYDGSFQRNYEENTLAPSATGSFLTPGQTTLIIPARTANPILTISKSGVIQQVAAGTPLPAGWAPSVGTVVDVNGLVQREAPAGAYNPNNPFNQDITDGTRFRLADFGNRVFRDTNDAFMASVGIKADNFLGNWSADMGFRYSQVALHTDDSLVSTSRFNKVLNQNDPIFNPSSASYIGTGTAYNPFGYFGVPIAANSGVVTYATSRVKDFDVSSLGNVWLGVSNPSIYTLPAGDMGVAAGVDYRDEQLTQSPDSLNQLGDTIGSSPATPTNARRKIVAYYAEANLPLVAPKQNIPGFHELSMNLAARYEDFVTSKITQTVPKVGLHWQPIDDTFVIRASYGKGIRQPSLYELYSGNTAGLQNLSDPRTGAVIQETPTIVGSNRLLRPEKTKSLTIGAVWTPKFTALNGFTVSLDLWRVERDGTVASDLQNTLDRWFGTAPGGKQPGESVLLDPAGNIVQVIAPFVNSGKTTAKGFDASASYLLKTQSAGRFDFQVATSYLDSFKYASLPGIPQTEYAGYDTTAGIDSSTGAIVNPGTGNDGYIKWKTRATVEWTYKGYGANVTGNFTDGFKDIDLNGDPYDVKSTWTYDAQITYQLHGELGSYLRDIKLTVGCLNVFDKNPPTSFGGGNNSTGYPGFLYSSVGRFVYGSLSKKF